MNRGYLDEICRVDISRVSEKRRYPVKVARLLLARRMEGSDHEQPSALAVIVPNGYGRAGTQDEGVIPIGALGP